jgi:hypothetical protein
MSDYPDSPPSTLGHVLQQGYASEKRMVPRTRRERMHDLKRELENKLKEVNAALEALDANPEVEKVMNAIEKVGI